MEKIVRYPEGSNCIKHLPPFGQMGQRKWFGTLNCTSSEPGSYTHWNWKLWGEGPGDLRAGREPDLWSWGDWPTCLRVWGGTVMLCLWLLLKSCRLDSTAAVGSNCHCCGEEARLLKERRQIENEASSHPQLLSLSQVSIIVGAWIGARWQIKNVLCRVLPPAWRNKLLRDRNVLTGTTGVTKSQWPGYMYMDC